MWVRLPPGVPSYNVCVLIDKLTVIVPTSAIPSHPSTELIEKAVRSMNKYVGTMGCRKIIVCDGCAPTPSYEEYKRRLLKLRQEDLDFSRSKVIEFISWVHLSSTLERAFQTVETEFALVFQHDHEVVREVDTEGILKCFDDPLVKHIRINRRANTRSGWDFMLEEYKGASIPLLKTAAWSDVPHFVRVDYYRKFVFPKLLDTGGRIRKIFPETVLNDHFKIEIGRVGFQEAHAKFGTFIYGSLNDPPVVEHIDGKYYKRPTFNFKQGDAI